MINALFSLDMICAPIDVDSKNINEVKNKDFINGITLILLPKLSISLQNIKITMGV